MQQPKQNFLQSMRHTVLFCSVTLANNSFANQDKNTLSSTITDTYIHGKNLKNSTKYPLITIINREELLATGLSNVGKLIQRLPSFSGSPIGT